MPEDVDSFLWLAAFIVACATIGFIVFTVSRAPDPSMDCVKFGGKWTAEAYSPNGFKIDGYCSK